MGLFPIGKHMMGKTALDSFTQGKNYHGPTFPGTVNQKLCKFAIKVNLRRNTSSLEQYILPRPANCTPTIVKSVISIKSF